MTVMDGKAFQERILTAGETVLVEYFAPWCGYCRRIGPGMEQLARKYEGRLAVAGINIDDEPELADREQIELVPTVVLYHRGQAVDCLVAPDSKARIEALIVKYLEEGEVS